PMTAPETTSYIKHHLALAGRSDPLFSDDAITLIHNTARGYPRAVNNLALQALVATFAANKSLVAEAATPAAVNQLPDDSTGAMPTTGDTSPTKAPPATARGAFQCPQHRHRQ